MSSLELLYIAFYFLFLILNIVAIQVLNPGAMTRESFKPQLEEPDTTKEDVYTMTENPMFSHRNDSSGASSPHEMETEDAPAPKVEKVD